MFNGVSEIFQEREISVQYLRTCDQVGQSLKLPYRTSSELNSVQTRQNQHRIVGLSTKADACTTIRRKISTSRATKVRM
jgi:hypothetical protein